MRKYLRILWLRNVMQFQSEITYRVEVVFLFLNTIVLISATVILYTLIFSQTKVVGDWNYVSMLYLFAVGSVAISLYTMFAWGPIYHQFRPAIKTGTMDTFLLKPMSPVFLALTGRFDMSGLARFVPSFGLLVYLVVKYPVRVGLGGQISFLIFFGVGLILLYLLVFLIYTFGFWTTSTDYFHHLTWAFVSAVSQPVNVFPRLVFEIFSTFVPVAFAAVFPVRILGGLEPISVELFLLLGVVLLIFLAASRVAWDRGLRRYGGVSA